MAWVVGVAGGDVARRGVAQGWAEDNKGSFMGSGTTTRTLVELRTKALHNINWISSYTSILGQWNFH